MGPELRVTLYLFNVGLMSALMNLCMCMKVLSVCHFTARELPNCVKKLKLAKL